MKILITGASGSGTTTLAREFSLNNTAWNCIDADDYYWLPTNPPFTQKRAPDERLQSLLVDLNSSDNSVVSGSILNWGAALEDAFDLIVFLYLDAGIRVNRVKEREIQKYGKVNPEFLKWLADYDDGPKEGRSLAKHEAWLSQRGCKVVRIEGDLSVAQRLEILTESLAR